MKKLMMAAAIVCAAACAQAATVSWSTGKFQTAGTGGNGWSGSGLTEATDGKYLAEIFFFTDSDCKTAVADVTGTSSTTSSKPAKAFSGETNDKFADNETYYTYLTITEIATGSKLTSETMSFTVNPLSDPNVNFWTGDGFNETKLSATYGDYQTKGWVAVPEPTSGLLLLLGVAGLALKRKRA